MSDNVHHLLARNECVARHWSARLVALGACADAVAWARSQPSYAEAWARCERAEWMLWLAGRLAGPPGDASRRPLVLAACDCAETTVARITDDHDMGHALCAIQTARAWAHGEATLDEVHDAAIAAYAAAAAADAATNAAAVATAAAATNAADATNAAAVAAAAAATAADAAANAAYAATAYATAYATYADARRVMADIVRAHYPRPPRMP